MSPVLELDLCRPHGASGCCIQARCPAGLYQLTGPGAVWLLRVLATGQIAGCGTAHLDGVSLHGCGSTESACAGRRPVVAWLKDDTPPRLLSPQRWSAGPPRAHGVPRGAAAARGRQALRRLGVLHLAHRPMCTLAPADVQRVALARALAQVPGLLLLERPDAPFAAVDRRALFALLVGCASAWEMVVLVIPTAPLDGVPVLHAG